MAKQILLAFLTIVTLLELASGLTLGIPSYLKACSRRDPKINECATKVAKEGLKEFAKGDPARNVPTMDPIFKKRITSKNADRGGLDFTLENIYIHGTSNMKIKKMTIDLEKRRVSLKSVNNLTLTADYEASGRIFVLPITGKGKAFIDILNFKSTYIFEYDLIKDADGDMHGKITKTEFPFTIGGAHYKFDGLFNGNKLLSDSTHDFLNQDWRILIDELGAPVIESMKAKIDEIIQKFLLTVTYDDLISP